VAVEAPGVTEAGGGVALEAAGRCGAGRSALVLRAGVAIGARTSRSVLGLLAVTRDALLEAGGGRRAMVERCGIRMAVEAGHGASGVFLLARVTGGTTAGADGCVGNGGVMDVVVYLAVERSARVTGGAGPYAVEPFGWVTGVAGRGHHGDAGMGVGAVAGRAGLAVM
jgi:hypothetical protein